VSLSFHNWLILFCSSWSYGRCPVLYLSVAWTCISCNFGFVITLHWPCALSCDGLFSVPLHALSHCPICDWIHHLGLQDLAIDVNSLYCPLTPISTITFSLMLQSSCFNAIMLSHSQCWFGPSACAIPSSNVSLPTHCVLPLTATHPHYRCAFISMTSELLVHGSHCAYPPGNSWCLSWMPPSSYP
jgi:hypothetical protein